MNRKIVLPRKTMYEDEILGYVNLLAIPNFRCVKMRNDLPAKPWKKECGILNLDSINHEGTHWVAWYKNGKERYYFDSFGQYPPFELLHYLKTSMEIDRDLPAIKRSAVTVQHDQSKECGALCLYVLKQLSTDIPFDVILETLLKRYYKNKTPALAIEI